MHVVSLRDLAASVRGRRADLGLSQAELAVRAHVSRQWIGELERGKATAEIGLVIRVLDALGLQLAVTESDAPSADAAYLDALLDEHRGA